MQLSLSTDELAQLCSDGARARGSHRFDRDLPRAARGLEKRPKPAPDGRLSLLASAQGGLGVLGRGIHGERVELEDALEATRRTLARLAPLSNDGARSPGVHRRQAAALRQPRHVVPVVRWPEDRTGACRGAPRAPSPQRSSRPLEPRSRGHLSARPADDDAASRGARAPRDLPRASRRGQRADALLRGG